MRITATTTTNHRHGHRAWHQDHLPRLPSAARYRWHGLAIIAVVIVNGAFSFVQEYRAERANRALAALLPEEATALRDGRKRRVPAAELVPGDVLLLAEGDRVSVDARVLQSDDLSLAGVRGSPCRPAGRHWPPSRPWCSPPSCWPRWPTPSSAAAP